MRIQLRIQKSLFPAQQNCFLDCSVTVGLTGEALRPQVIFTGRCQRIWPTYAVIGWLTKTLTDAFRDWFSRKTIPQSFAAAEIDPVPQMCLPSLLASSEGQRIFINIRSQYGIQKNIYVHPAWSGSCSWLTRAMLSSVRTLCDRNTTLRHDRRV